MSGQQLHKLGQRSRAAAARATVLGELSGDRLALPVQGSVDGGSCRYRQDKALVVVSVGQLKHETKTSTIPTYHSRAELAILVSF